MTLTKRDLGRLAFVGSVALASSGLLLDRRSLAQSADQVGVEQAVEALREAILEVDEAKLGDLLADELSYGLWPSGFIQNKFEFVNTIADKKTIYTSITYSDPNTTIAGNTAIVRHRETVVAHSDEKAWSVEFGVLQIWQRQDSQWRLLARQGWKT
jgi:hypothetical protein